MSRKALKQRFSQDWHLSARLRKVLYFQCWRNVDASLVLYLFPKQLCDTILEIRYKRVTCEHMGRLINGLSQNSSVCLGMLHPELHLRAIVAFYADPHKS